MSTYKTKWGRSIAVAMAAALVFTGLPGTETQAAKKAKLSTKKLTVTVGKKKTIKIKNKAKKAKYTFKSKKASIAKVSKKGVVTGKKKGNTKITVTEKKGKKTRKLGTVKVTVKPVKKPAASKAPSQPTAPVVAASTNPTQPTTAPDNPSQGTPEPQESTQPSKNPATPPVKASKPPTPPPTDKPTPKPDPWTPQGKGWEKIDLSKWSGDEGNYFETGDQFILEDVQSVSVPLPETPVIDQLNQKVEVLVRGSVSADSEGFRFWLVNANEKTMTGQYNYMAGGHKFIEGPKDAPTEIEKGTFEPGKSFQLQNVFTTNNWDQDTDLTCKSILLKATAPGGTLAGVTITGIWVRYGDTIGTSTEDPNVPGTVTPKPETPPVDTSNTDTSTGEKPGETTKPDVALTVANSYAAGPLFDADGKDLGKGIENSDGSITFYTSAKYSGGGLNFYLSPDKGHFDYTKYSKIRITLSGKETDPDALGLYLGLVCDGKKAPPWDANADPIQVAIDGKPNAYPSMKGGNAEDVLEMDLSDITVPSDTDLGADCGIVALQIKYNGYQKDEAVKSTVTIKSIELIKK